MIPLILEMNIVWNNHIKKILFAIFLVATICTKAQNTQKVEVVKNDNQISSFKLDFNYGWTKNNKFIDFSSCSLIFLLFA